MNVVALFNNIRGYENLLPVLKDLSTHNSIELIYTPYTKDPSWDKCDSWLSNPAVELKLDSLVPNEEVISELIGKSYQLIKNADVLLLADVQNFPGADIYQSVKIVNSRIKVIGFQHGLYQVWTRHWFNKNCDFYFGYGRQALDFFPELRRRNLVCCGIPKLDNIKNVSKYEEKFILFIGQRYPGPEVIDPFLAKVEKYFGTQVVVRNHPQYPELYKFKSSLIDSQSVPDDLLEQISQAKFVITTHSSCLIDALLLKKHVVLVPNHGLSQLRGYKAVAKDFSAEQVEVALSIAQRWDCSNWLNEMITTTNFDATTLTVNSIYAIVGVARRGYYRLFLKSKFQALLELVAWLERLGLAVKNKSIK
jgi:hypothetical protein